MAGATEAVDYPLDDGGSNFEASTSGETCFSPNPALCFKQTADNKGCVTMGQCNYGHVVDGPKSIFFQYAK